MLEKALLNELEKLSAGEQRKGLSFARSLTQEALRGVSGRTYGRLAGSIAAGDLARRERAIAEGCEKVNPDEW